MASQVQNIGKQVLRSAKNYTKGYSETQQLVRAATSNDAWGPSGAEMSNLAQLSYNQQDFVEIMEMLDKRLNDTGKMWRHVFKALTLLDYLLHAGSENVVIYFKENAYIVKTLKEFVYIDDDGKDQGSNVRQKAKEISALLMDDARLREERKGRASMRDRLSGIDPSEAPPSSSDSYYKRRGSRAAATTSRNQNREDSDLQRAIEESKRMADEEGGRNGPAPRRNDEDGDLEKAMRLSREEEEARQRALGTNQNGLFDEQKGDQLIDFSSNNTSQAQPQMQMITGQYTGMPQFNSYNPYAAQAQAQQEEYLRMQQQLEMQRQMSEQQAQAQAYQQMLQQQAMQQQQYFQAQHTAMPLVPQQTSYGSNNPFASFATSSPPQPQQPQLSSLSTSFPTSAYSNSAPPSAEPMQRPTSTGPVSAGGPRRNNAADEQHSALAAMLGSGGPGIDTYGNTGNLRIPAGSPFHPSNRTTSPGGAPNPFTIPQQTGQNQQQQQQPFFNL